MYRTKANILTFMALQVNSAIDQNKFKITVKEMSELLRNGKLFDYLESHSECFDMSLVNPEDREYVNRNVGDLNEAYGSHKFGVSNNGLSTLLGYLLELLDRSLEDVDAWDVNIYIAKSKITISKLPERKGNES